MFCAVLEWAVRDWKQTGQHFRIQLQTHTQVLTDPRFAADILLCALSLQQILLMVRWSNLGCRISSPCRCACFLGEQADFCDKHVSLALRVKFFDAVVTPVACFGAAFGDQSSHAGNFVT